MKKIPYGRQYIDDDDIKGVVKVLKSDWISQGPKIREFEEALSGFTGAKYAVAVSGGTPALHLSMVALGIGRGDKVISSPITFCASVDCAVHVGAEPTFIDIDDTTYHMDMERLKNFLKVPSQRRRVKAVILVHFMGTVADITEAKRICDKYGVGIVEDAAHAMGARYTYKAKWFNVGSSAHSDATIFSFHPIKNITTGEGGAILTNSKKIYALALRLRHHGIVGRDKNFWFYDIPQPGYNYRITDFQSALGISQIKKLNWMVRRKREIVRAYNKELSKIKGIRFPYERKNTFASYHLYVIRVERQKRDNLYRFLRRNNIFTQVNYIPVHLFSFYRKIWGFRYGDFPVAERYYRECLSLPLYVGLTKKDQARVIESINKFLNN